jgi:hypothetical protein
MEKKVYIEDAEEFAKKSETYRLVLEHRQKCKNWGKKFCIECFGGGLTLFTKNLLDEGLLIIAANGKKSIIGLGFDKHPKKMLENKTLKKIVLDELNKKAKEGKEIPRNSRIIIGDVLSFRRKVTCSVNGKYMIVGIHPYTGEILDFQFIPKKLLPKDYLQNEKN